MANFKYSPMPMLEEERRALALQKLVAERAAYAKKNKGNYPSDEELMKSRKKKGK
jgi:hypothetical protein